MDTLLNTKIMFICSLIFLEECFEKFINIIYFSKISGENESEHHIRSTGVGVAGSHQYVRTCITFVAWFFRLFLTPVTEKNKN